MSEGCKLPEELTIYTIGELFPQWLQWLEVLPMDLIHDDPLASALVVDAHDVAEVDGAGLQMLVALSHALKNRQRHLVLREPSDALLQACAALGLRDWLMAEPAMECAA
jgi:anti-anti-sigma regulatory factor